MESTNFGMGRYIGDESIDCMNIWVRKKINGYKDERGMFFDLCGKQLKLLYRLDTMLIYEKTRNDMAYGGSSSNTDTGRGGFAGLLRDQF